MSSLTFPVYVKPPQSGKTQDAIIRPMEESLKNGRIPVVIIPSRIQLQKQLTKRLLEEFSNEEDDLGVQKIMNMVNLSPRNIGRFDTGNVGNRLSGARHALRLLETGDVKAFVVLNNASGMNKLLCTMAQSKKKFDIIVDEIHGFMNVSVDSDFDREESKFLINNQFLDPLRFHQERKKILEHTKINTDPVTRLVTLFHLIRENNHSFSGCTATVSYIVQSPLINILDLDPRVIQLNIPECYYGYERVEKKTYQGGYKDAILKVIQNCVFFEKTTTTMCHVDRKQSKHTEAAYFWIDTCLDEGVDPHKILSIIDNGDGYSLYNYQKILKQYQKSRTSEPWRLVNAYRRFGYDFIGIFGDRCMSESNTYQKCNGDINCPINDMIVVPFQTKLNDMTTMIQKIGRIFGNDTIGGNRRIIWFPQSEGESYREKLEKGLALDYHIQNESTLKRVNFKRVMKLARSGKLDQNGDIVENGNQETLPTRSYGDLEEKMKEWAEYNNNSNISRIMKNIDRLNAYSKVEIIKFLSSHGAKNPSSTLRDLQNNNTGYGMILERINEKYKMIPEVAEIHQRVFNN